MIVTDIQRLLRAAKRQHLRPVAIEIGEKQARALADYANDMLYPRRPSDDPVTWEMIASGPSNFFCGVPVVGVESPDYLSIVTANVEART